LCIGIQTRETPGDFGYRHRDQLVAGDGDRDVLQQQQQDMKMPVAVRVSFFTDFV